MRHYAYFFTRQDISPEYQIVQTAHAAFQMGVNSQRWIDSHPEKQQVMEEIQEENTYFTVVGVRNLDALLAVTTILDKFVFKYEVFHEADLGGEPTSIAVYPIAEKDRGPLLAFNLLKIDKRG
jgi:hypothetical protein